MNLYSATNRVLKRLDDYPAVGGEREWPRAEIELYVKDGYNAFCRRTKAIFDFFYAENLAACGNVTARWEENYVETGMLVTGLIQYTGGYWEMDYAEPGAVGPIALNHTWESEYAESTFPASLGKVPEDNVTVDRATHDYIDLDPEFSQFFEEHDRNYQTNQGEPQRFAMDRDGIGAIRMVPGGAGGATEYSVRLFPRIWAHWGLGEASGDREDTAGDYLSWRGPYTLTDETGIGTASGVYGKAALFVRSNADYMSANPIDLGEIGFGLTFWVKLTSLVNFNHVIAASNFGVFSGASGHMTAAIVDDEGTEIQATINSAWSDTSQWHFAAIWWSPDDGRLHLLSQRVSNGFGSLDTASVATVSTLASMGSTLRLGSSITGTNFLNGAVQDVTLWRGVPSADGLVWLYNSGAGRTFPYQYDGTFPDSNARRAGTWPYGLARYSDATDFGAWAPLGVWGSLREIPEHFPMGGQYGIPRRLFSDVDNTRVEYYRLGKDPGQYQFELPDRFVKYVEHYAESKALERDGPGQDLALSKHFMQRFEDGVSRMSKRLNEHRLARGGSIGSAGAVMSRPGLARLPWRYGRQIRKGY